MATLSPPMLSVIKLPVKKELFIQWTDNDLCLVSQPQLYAVRYKINTYIQKIVNMQGSVKHRRSSYQREFDIERSWIPSHKDITESMLSYSRRMSEYKMKPTQQATDNLELPLLIKATHLPHPNRPDRSRRNNREMNKKPCTYRVRSLPNMKLEPLLGPNARYELDSDQLSGLKSISGVQLKFLKSAKISNQLPPIDDQPIKNEKNVTIDNSKQTTTDSAVTEVTFTPKDATKTPETMNEEKKVAGGISNELAKSQKSQPNSKPFVPTHGLKRKNKRMKFKKSQLSAIEEIDDSEVLLQRLSRSSTYNKLPLPPTYNPATTVVDKDRNYLDIQQSFEERRRDVALLRKIHNSSNTQRTNSQINMQTLAKKKLRKLPLLPISKAVVAEL
ncbi:uncharacterized protein [Watersipora subatra]|uniref:uncharacterized protein n=1 Tax=Watersipora subatra TaxID=2589382 RepID=UPI00355B0971